VLEWAYASFDRVALVASFQAESSVLIDMASKIREPLHVLTLDTGRLPQETHEFMDLMRERYRIELDVRMPDPRAVRKMVATFGPNLFYQSAVLRRHCCEVRKEVPLSDAFAGYDAWITGIRREQTPQRSEARVVGDDPARPGLTKIAPLATWSHAQVAEYISRNNVPKHPLYERGYTSIGCGPCTRPTSAGEDPRAGRWWWEVDGVKECGLQLPARQKASTR
jgi:phosphoadenosine phosphosulfate reductase